MMEHYTYCMPLVCRISPSHHRTFFPFCFRGENRQSELKKQVQQKKPPVKKFLMKFFLQEKHIRILTNSNSDTVNVLQRSAKTDAIPEIQQINPLVRELCQKDEVISLVLFGSVARGQARSISDIDLLYRHRKKPAIIGSLGSPQLWIPDG
jgi:UTP:GlnB (protein PII) uridylyltransferase